MRSWQRTALSTARRAARPLRRVVRHAEHRVAERRDPALAWLSEALRRHSGGPDAWDKMWQDRKELIRKLAPDRSFLDVGGMFGIAGELSFIAEESGATRVVLFDGMDPSDEFAEEHRRRGSRVQFVQGDFHDPAAIAALGPFDFVWCTGVIYHSPHPMQQILYLRQLTLDYLMFGIHIIPDMPGIEQACILYPGISPEMQETFAKFHGGRERFPGMAVPFDPTPLMAYANMWWGISPSALRSMLHFSGFEITEEFAVTPFWIDLLARPGGQSVDIYPPFGQSRERVRRRHDGVPTEQIPPWAAGQVADIRRSPVT
jgi:hypothetical protein